MRRRLELLILAAIVVAGLLFTHIYISFFSAPAPPRFRTVEITKGMTFRAIAAALENEGVIRDKRVLLFAGSIIGAHKSIKAGEYEFAGGMNLLEVLDMLVKGRVKSYSITIPEGYNIKEIAALLAKDALVNAEEFQSRAMDKTLATELGVEGPTLEGYLYPDTYVFTKGMSAEEIIGKMAGRFKSLYYSEIEILARVKGMPMKKVVTLASIIEKETGAPGERGMISAVFHNRLKKRIRLQSDPTVIYALKDFNGNLTRKDLLKKTPYNTYIHYGLPPGPIASPGRASLLAALNPDSADYIYFVSRNDGTHHFSSTLKDHNRAVNTFQKKLRRSPIKPRSA